MDSEVDISMTSFGANHEGKPLNCPKFGIFIDRKQKRVVLGIRGTMNYSDIRSDLNREEVEVKGLGGYAHAGIYE